MYGETSALEAQCDRPVPALGQVKAAAERLYKTTCQVESFLGRFNGQPAVAQNNTGAAGHPVQGNYRNDIESLFLVIDQLELVVGQLDYIG